MSGEGGCLLVNDPELALRAEIIREKGTDRGRFFAARSTNIPGRTSVRHSCQTSSPPPSSLGTARTGAAHHQRTAGALATLIHEMFAPLEQQGLLRRPIVPADCGTTAKCTTSSCARRPTPEGSCTAEAKRDRRGVSLRAAALIAGGPALRTRARRSLAHDVAVAAPGPAADVAGLERSPATTGLRNIDGDPEKLSAAMPGAASPGSGSETVDSPFLGVERGVKVRRRHRRRPRPARAGPGIGATPAMPAGPSWRCSARTSLRSAFLSVTSRRSTSLSTQPAWESPWRRRTNFWLVRSRKTAMASLSPTTAPISVSGGRSGSAAFWGGGATGSTGGATTARCGGRREAVKIGRSDVAVRTENGIDHNGLPLGRGLTASRFGLAIGLTLPRSTVSASPGPVVGQDVQGGGGRSLRLRRRNGDQHSAG